MSAARLPAALEATALIRLAEANGGFGMVLHRGEPDSGTIVIVILNNQGFGQTLARAFERLPRADGTRGWAQSKAQDPENKAEFEDYLKRRVAQDRDLWIVELTIAEGEQLILNLDTKENKPGFMG
ncbi:DUF1491 family protein [Novosphingobium sp.]|uniref:DUF1491 family protein n=1 Tax=Novosphingobium sp. TaxID=1874826 RepID=UPI00260DAB61|nr:DUF1491 family protein [Novosphingobium sp.]